jgi:predicted Rossmann fold flavoprotein
MQVDNINFLIIGAGPAGMIAAISAKLNFPTKKIVIIEKNDSCGKKLLITGKGRCNLTTSNTDISEFINKLGKKSKWLRSALNVFSIEDTINFFESLGVSLKQERGNRIFPDSDSAESIRNVLVNKIKELNIQVIYNSKVICIEKKLNQFLIKTREKDYNAKNLCIATGGLSYPGTGSSGDGYFFSKELGHTIIKPSPSLVGLITKEAWSKKIPGLTLKNVQVEIYLNNKKYDEQFGDILFTHVGVSGPIILNMSKNIHHLISINDNNVYLHVDLKPKVSYQQLNQRIFQIIDANNKKNLFFLLSQLLPKAMIDMFLIINDLQKEVVLCDLTKDSRKKIIASLKKIIITIGDVESIDKAIITSGGVSLGEINPQTMSSKVVSNLFFAGEILDLDGPTGGYNLQIAWSTGFLAGKSIDLDQD